MRKLKNSLLPLALMSSISLLDYLYDYLNNGNRGAHMLVTDLDRKIPLVKAFVVPYLGWYILLFTALAYLCLRDRKIYYTTLLSINIGMLACSLFYYLFQTTVPRPQVDGVDCVSLILANIYQVDQPYNCFPSIHCLTSFLLMKAINNSPIRNKWNMLLIHGMASSVIISTLLIKQHVVIDVIGALLLGQIIFDTVRCLKIEKVSMILKKTYLFTMMKKKFGI